MSDATPAAAPDAAAATAKQEPAAKGGSKKKLLIIVASAVVALGAAGGGAFFFMSKGDHEATAENDEDAQDAAEAEAEADSEEEGKAKAKSKSKSKKAKGKKAKVAAPKAPAIYVEFEPPFVVNFEAKGVMRFLQVSIQVLSRDHETAEIIKQHDPKVRNNLLMLLGSQTYETISTVEGKEGLRKQALETVAKIVDDEGGKPKEVEDLYFTSFVMQ